MGILRKKVARRWVKEPGFLKRYGALDEALSLASQLIDAGARAHLMQAQVVDRMGTSQSAIANAGVGPRGLWRR